MGAPEGAFAGNISIHALLAESDFVGNVRGCFFCLFLSTLSLRRATCPAARCTRPTGISIHALLAESDRWSRIFSLPRSYFYPRSPCGERLDAQKGLWPSRNISIHALLAESDVQFQTAFTRQPLFLSTLSLRRATLKNAITAAPQQEFLSTLSLRRATTADIASFAGLCNFYPRSPCGERHQLLAGAIVSAINFYPRSPCGERRRQRDSQCSTSDISIHALLAESDSPRDQHRHQ